MKKNNIFIIKLYRAEYFNTIIIKIIISIVKYNLLLLLIKIFFYWITQYHNYIYYRAYINNIINYKYNAVYFIIIYINL